MLIKIKDLYERIFASASSGEAFDKPSTQTRLQHSDPKAEPRNANSIRQTETIKDQKR